MKKYFKWKENLIKDEFGEYIYETIGDILEYCGKDEGKFKDFCLSFLSVLYCEEYDELFIKYLKEVKDVLEEPHGRFILEIPREGLKKFKKEKEGKKDEEC